MIPKLIHRLWLNPPGPPMPQKYRAYGEEWKRLHPDWDVVDWTRLGAAYPLDNQHVYNAAQDYPDVHRFRSSMVRLELIYRYGGVYVDTDFQPLKPIDELLDGHTCVLAESANRRKDGGGIVSDSFLAAEPEHPFFAECVRRIPESARLYQGKHTAVSVGPYHMDRVLKAGSYDLHILEPWVFYPQSIAERKAGRPVDLSRAYGWHQWANTMPRKAAWAS